MNITRCIRAIKNKDTPYFMVSQSLMKDKRLSSISRGLILEILNHDYESDHPYVLNVGVLKKESGLKRVTFYKAWNELQEYGYITTINHGKNNWETIIKEVP